MSTTHDCLKLVFYVFHTCDCFKFSNSNKKSYHIHLSHLLSYENGAQEKLSPPQQLQKAHLPIATTISQATSNSGGHGFSHGFPLKQQSWLVFLFLTEVRDGHTPHNFA